MNTADFTYLLQNPKEIRVDQISDIRTIIDEFPYFQPARALYLKGLKDSESFRYNQELKITAAHTTDRSVLFDFITSEEFIQNDISDKIKQNFENLKNIEILEYEELSSDPGIRVDSALKTYIQKNETELTFEPLSSDKTVSDFVEENTQTAEEKLEIGKPLKFDKGEMHSFAEWLKITSFKPIIREEKSEEKVVKKDDGKQRRSDLIDKFIETNPKIEPAKGDAPIQDIASSRIMKPDSLMTETLARIYLEQKNYEKAIQAYNILSLKYPEKSSFFADQIQAIKDLQDRNK